MAHGTHSDPRNPPASVWVQKSGDGPLPPESAAVHHAGLLAGGTRVRAFDGTEFLRGTLTLPFADLVVGSVEVVRTAFQRHGGGVDPAPIDYPYALHPWLGRSVHPATLAEVRARLQRSQAPLFVKPKRTKQFAAGLYTHPDALAALPAETPVWWSLPHAFTAEYRLYVLHGQVVGTVLYAGDEALDDAPALIDAQVVLDALSCARAEWPEMPAGFAMDWALDASGNTVLVECNDGWALGYYRPLAPATYLHLLAARWHELVAGEDR